jgi:hypothetical protein
MTTHIGLKTPCKRHGVPMDPTCVACDHQTVTGERVDVIQYEYPDGCSGAFFCARDETFRLLDIYERRGCRLWYNDLYLGE